MADDSKKKAEIKISGMHCASCALNVEKSLNDLEGVDEAKVNFGTEKATVKYDSNKVKQNSGLLKRAMKSCTEYTTTLTHLPTIQSLALSMI